MECKTLCQLEQYSRITGYFQPLQQWNPGKAEEFKNRVTYEIKSKNTQVPTREVSHNNT